MAMRLTSFRMPFNVAELGQSSLAIGAAGTLVPRRAADR